MDRNATNSNVEGMAQDEVLETILSDELFNGFDPVFWTSAEGWTWFEFSEDAFPVLVKYHLGNEVDELTKKYQWLTDLAVPSKRHESVRIFQQNPARNLTLLDVFAKLQFLKLWGSTMMLYPSCFIYSEMFKIVTSASEATEIRSSDSGIGAEEEIMRQDFGKEWTDFVEQNSEKMRIIAEVPRVLLSRTSWLTMVEKSDCERAMSASLVNSSNIDAIGRFSWRRSEIIRSWTQIKEHPSESIHLLIMQGLERAWKEVISASIEKDSRYMKIWSTFSDSIWSLCLTAGCSKADRRDPFKSLEILRDLISRQFTYTADLHSTISQLNRQIILQQRMITALAYRNVLENVSTTNPGFNPTEKWRAFVEKTLPKVADKDVEIHNDNPLKGLIDQHKNSVTSLSALKQMASDLYPNLSRTIHHFQPAKDFDQYTPMPGQWDPVQIKFMTAMKPREDNLLDDGYPDWKKERLRYTTLVVAPAVDPVVEAVKNQESTVSPKKGKKKNKKR